MKSGPALPHDILAEPDADRRAALDLAGLLAELGLPRAQALVCVELARRGSATSRELETGLALRQPEVSVATRDLRRAGWLEVRTEKTQGKGRPVNHYRLTLRLADVIARLETDQRQEMRALERRMDEAKRLARELPAGSG